MIILFEVHTTIHNIRVYQKYIFIHIYLTKLLPTGRLSTSCSPPHTHTSLHRRLSILKDYLFTCNTNKYKSEKYISASNETRRCAKLNSRAIMIYGDSAAHTIGPHSDMQSVLAATDFYINRRSLSEALTLVPSTVFTISSSVLPSREVYSSY